MKPQQVLTQLEREPIVFFGCTWSEIKGQLFKSALFSFLIAIAVVILLTTAGFPFQVTFAVFMILITLGTMLFTKWFLANIASLRAGKPLFYEKHHAIHRRNQFIQPSNTIFQRERNQ